MDISICITTYNLEKYIVDCLESVLTQETKFNYEIIISDDCSTDNTIDILKKYQQKHPRKIKILTNTKNLKYSKNYLKALSHCQGRYIAILDGDDYWTNTNKLQKQIEYLENNTDCNLVHHDGLCLFNDNTNKPFNHKTKPEIYGLHHLLTDANIWNSSVVYRNIYQSNFPDWLSSEDVPNYPIYPDYPLHVLHAKNGNVHFMKEIMGVYRIHEDNISQKIGNIKSMQNSLWIAEKLEAELESIYHSSIKLMKSRLNDVLAGQFLKQRKYKLALYHIFKSYSTTPFRSKAEYKDSYYHLFIN